MKIALITPGNEYYLKSDNGPNAKIHPYRRWVYERINKAGHQCDYIGESDLVKDRLIGYDVLFLLNHARNSEQTNDTLLNFLAKGKHVFMCYDTKAAKDWGIASGKKCFFDKLDFKSRQLSYSAQNTDNLLVKINKKFLNNTLDLKRFFSLFAIEIRPADNHEVLARWLPGGAPALVKIKKNQGNVIYFSGVLAATDEDFLRYVLSFFEGSNKTLCPVIPNNKKCCVTIFYDYEAHYGNAEYGGGAHKGLPHILSVHKKHNIKATFNVVGRLFEEYPQSIRDIINDKHEIACHTYEHIVPKRTEHKTLNASIRKSMDVFAKDFAGKFKGFRSPESKWNADLVKILEECSFQWNAEDEAATLPYYLVLNEKLSLIRMPITCDDYPYFGQNRSGEYMLDRFKQAIEKGINTNSFVAIGFHPWIVGMNQENLSAFEQFISYISSRNDLAFMTFGEVADWWKQRNS